MTPKEQALRRLFKQQQLAIAKTYKRAGERRKAEYELLLGRLPEVGMFYRTTEGRLLFFREGDHRLYDL